jgi:hypothetical protein
MVANLHEVSLAEAVVRYHQRVATSLADKQARIDRGAFRALDHFPCWYCVQYLDKVAGLRAMPSHPWARESSAVAEGTYDGDTRAAGAAPP